MKNLSILVLIAFLAISCNKGLNYLYRIDNGDLAEQLDSMKQCQGLYDIISENVVFDIQDSIFLVNDGIWYFLKDYKPCLDKLNDSLLISFLGTPDSIIMEPYTPLYACYKADISPLYPKFYGMGLWAETSFNAKHFRLKSLSERNFKYKKENGWVQSTDFSLFKYNHDDRQVVGESWECRYTRQKASKLSYKKIGTNHHFINGYELIFTGQFCNADLAFTKSEMQAIFGKPNFISNDTLFYQTISIPFANISGRFPNYKGKFFCSIFVKNPTGGFAYMGGLLVDPRRLE